MRHFSPPVDLLRGRSPQLSLKAMEPLFASAGLGVWHFDVQAETLWWSSRAHEIHETGLQGKMDRMAALAFCSDKSRAAIEDAIHKAFQHGASWDLTIPITTAKGRPILLRCTGLTTSDDGTTTHILGIFEDVTDAHSWAEEHARLGLLVEQMTNAALISDCEGRTIWTNAAFEKLTGYCLADLVGKTPGSVLQGPGTNPETVQAISTALKQGEPFHGEILNYRKDGSPYWIEIDLSPIRDAVGTITGFVAIESDASARREAQAMAVRELETRRSAEILLRDILDTVPTAISAYDRSNHLMVLNRKAQEILPKEVAPLKPGMSLSDALQAWSSVEEQPTPTQARITALVQASEREIAPFESRLADGRWLLSAASRSTSGNLIWVRTDISAIKTAELEARERASHDALTGLLNRRGFFEEFARFRAQSGRRGATTGCLAVFDIDHFKSVNDVYGHESGDILLRTIGRRLSRSVRATDLVARLGGDEFALFLPGIDISETQKRMETISGALCRATRLRLVRMQPSISMGVAMITNQNEDCEELMRRADRALYEGKNLGRGRIMLYTDLLADDLAKRRRLADRLHRALTAEQVQVAVQPQLRLCDDSILSFEALARWQDGDSWVSPAEFVAAAEQHGLAEKLGSAILRKALAACREIRDLSGEAITVGVNVGTGQLLAEDFASIVLDALSQADLPPSALELEITETVILDRSFARIEPALSHLRSLGVRIALDDFGTGHASLRHLGDLSIDSLKIDRSFVAAIGLDKRRELIARTIVGLAQGLELDCVAEGVETAQQKAFLERHGCSHIQGYLIGRPMWANQAVDLLSARRKGPATGQTLDRPEDQPLPHTALR